MAEPLQSLPTESQPNHSTDVGRPVRHSASRRDALHPSGRLDPKRFHGAWIFLCESIGAGSLVGARHGVEPALLAGTACAGAFLVIAAISAGVRGRARQLLIGGALVVAAPILALMIGADSRFMMIAGAAIFPAGATVILARRHGFLSPIVLATGVAALAMAAPIAAMAGGASPSRATILFLILWSLFYWRSLIVASLAAGSLPWNADLLRTRGLREAALTASCSLVVAIVLKATA